MPHETPDQDLAAVGNDTGSSTTEAASDDARVCPQDGKVCWEAGCQVEYCKGRYEGREAAFEEVTAHWFLQGGQSEFGPIGKDKIISGDSLIADILARVRQCARPARHIPANDPEWQRRMMLAVEGWLHPVSSTPAASPALKSSSSPSPSLSSPETVEHQMESFGVKYGWTPGSEFHIDLARLISCVRQAQASEIERLKEAARSSNVALRRANIASGIATARAESAEARLREAEQQIEALKNKD